MATQPQPPHADTSPAQSMPSFVLQRISGEEPHYDLCLEHDGYLKSWAVFIPEDIQPTTTSLPARHLGDYELGMMEYEGSLVENDKEVQVNIWDKGVWQPYADVASGIENGYLPFALQGGHLKGEWILQRVQEQSGHYSWVLKSVYGEMAAAQRNTVNQTLGLIHPTPKPKDVQVAELPAEEQLPIGINKNRMAMYMMMAAAFEQRMAVEERDKEIMLGRGNSIQNKFVPIGMNTVQQQASRNGSAFSPSGQSSITTNSFIGPAAVAGAAVVIGAGKKSPETIGIASPPPEYASLNTKAIQPRAGEAMAAESQNLETTEAIGQSETSHIESNSVITTAVSSTPEEMINSSPSSEGNNEDLSAPVEFASVGESSITSNPDSFTEAGSVPETVSSLEPGISAPETSQMGEGNFPDALIIDEGEIINSESSVGEGATIDAISENIENVSITTAGALENDFALAAEAPEDAGLGVEIDNAPVAETLQADFASATAAESVDAGPAEVAGIVEPDITEGAAPEDSTIGGDSTITSDPEIPLEAGGGVEAPVSEEGSAPEAFEGSLDPDMSAFEPSEDNTEGPVEYDFDETPVVDMGGDDGGDTGGDDSSGQGDDANGADEAGDNKDAENDQGGDAIGPDGQTMEGVAEPLFAFNGQSSVMSRFGVDITHTAQEAFANAHITKGDLADYYTQVASSMLPFLQGHEVLVVRDVNGQQSMEKVSINSEEDILQQVERGVVEFRPYPEYGPEGLQTVEIRINAHTSDDAASLHDYLAGHNIVPLLLTNDELYQVLIPVNESAHSEAVIDYLQNDLREKGINWRDINVTVPEGEMPALAPFSAALKEDTPINVPLTWESLSNEKHALHVKDVLENIDVIQQADWGAYYREAQHMNSDMLHKLQPAPEI